MRTNLLSVRWPVVALLGGVILAGALPAPASPSTTPVGLWRQFDDKTGDLRSLIRLELVSGELVGTVVKPYPRPGEPAEPKCDKCPAEFKDKPIAGLRILWGLRGSGGDWDGGRVLDPEEGKIYKVKLKLSDDGQKLEVRGYIGFSMIGRSQEWRRAE